MSPPLNRGRLKTWTWQLSADSTAGAAIEYSNKTLEPLPAAMASRQTLRKYSEIAQTPLHKATRGGGSFRASGNQLRPKMANFGRNRSTSANFGRVWPAALEIHQQNMRRRMTLEPWSSSRRRPRKMYRNYSHAAADLPPPPRQAQSPPTEVSGRRKRAATAPTSRARSGATPPGTRRSASGCRCRPARRPKGLRRARAAASRSCGRRWRGSTSGCGGLSPRNIERAVVSNNDATRDLTHALQLGRACLGPALSRVLVTSMRGVGKRTRSPKMGRPNMWKR